MADVDRLEETEDARRRRDQAEAMERMLLAQEETDGLLGEGHDHDANEGGGINGPGDDDMMVLRDQQRLFHEETDSPSTPLLRRLSYVQASALAAAGLIFYALRTRQQLYLAIVFMASSKMAYVILGNALVAMAVTVFKLSTGFSLGGLRRAEAEGLGDFFRWNITETCLALTMFRSELDVTMAIQFLLLVVAKCVHWVADLRERHVRLTLDAITIVRVPILGWEMPWISLDSFKLVALLSVLQSLDLYFVVQCGQSIITSGPSVSLFFAFEAAILVVSSSSSILMWDLHVMDGLIAHWHEKTTERAVESRQESEANNEAKDANADDSEGKDEQAAPPPQPEQPRKHSLQHTLVHRYIYPMWKNHKATFEFAVEVQAQMAKFVLYLSFFALVMVFYGLPINLIREVYLSWVSLRQRLVAFGKYRSLLASMDKFESPTEEDDISEPCIICRDELTLSTSKKLPGCGHIFHTGCLREWLVQQPTCPTCRSDIEAMQARERRARREAAEREEAQAEEQRQAEGLAFMEDFDRAARERQAEVDGQTDFESTLADPASTNESRTTRSKFEKQRAVFPALYRVTNETGASVWKAGEDGILAMVRTVPKEKVVLGQELQWWRDPDSENSANCLMLRMPDGWVRDADVSRIVGVLNRPKYKDH